MNSEFEKREAYEEAARVCERMVVGGRAWSDEQRVAADALLAAAKNIRALAQAQTNEGGVEVSGHTPGPWFIHWHGDEGSGYVYPAMWNGRDNTPTQLALIARVSSWTGEPKYVPEARANAALIAAAPDLLDAVQRLVAMLPDHEVTDCGDVECPYCRTVQFAIDAILKATVAPAAEGES